MSAAFVIFGSFIEFVMRISIFIACIKDAPQQNRNIKNHLEKLEAAKAAYLSLSLSFFTFGYFSLPFLTFPYLIFNLLN